MSTDQKQFSPWREALWPIHGYEMKKFFPMSLIMFCVLFNYTALRNLKDGLIITAPGSGAEVVNFLKAWIVFPASIGFVILYAKLNNMFTQYQLYYVTLFPFIIFFALFGFVLYPNKELLHPSLETVQYLQQAYPNFKWVFPIYGYWTYAVFYTMAELWGNIGITLLFWQFANETTRTNEAKRFYGLFGLAGNTALIGAGVIVKHFMSGKKATLASSTLAESSVVVDHFGNGIQSITLFVLFMFFAIIALYAWLNHVVLKDPRFAFERGEGGSKKKSKEKLSVKESFKLILRSPYLGYIAILMLAYGVTINLTEVTWKDQVKIAYPDPSDYTGFMADFFFWTGVITMLLIYSAKNLVRRFGWTMGAMATPVMMLITGPLFFLFVIFREDLQWMTDWFSATPVIMAVMIGAIQNVLSKGTKYSLFDPTKEMAYMPLDDTQRRKGKAAVDVAAGRMGKSAGGHIQQVLLIVTAGTQLTIAPYLALFLCVLIGAWIWAVYRLSYAYEDLLEQRRREGVEV